MSKYGFVNAPPRTRSSRKLVQEKDKRELSLINSRMAFASPQSSVGQLIHAQEARGPAFVEESRRFEGDFAADEKSRRETRAARREELHFKVLESRLTREKETWASMAETFEAKENDRQKRAARLEDKQGPAHVLTHAPLSNAPGRALAEELQRKKQREEIRVAWLRDKQPSKFNPLTGEPDSLQKFAYSAFETRYPV